MLRVVMASDSTATPRIENNRDHKRDRDRAGFLLRKLLVSHPEFLAHHTWVSELDRWAELVYALLSTIAPEHRIDIRETVRRLQALGLLDIKLLADEESGLEQHRQISEILEESGFDANETAQALQTMREAAATIRQQFDGRLQFFLRHYGEIMLEDLCNQFHFSALDDSNVEQAFALWLQNSCGLPVSLFDQYVLEFCYRNDLSLEDLVAGADEQNLNLALVDDLVRGHLDKQKAEG